MFAGEEPSMEESKAKPSRLPTKHQRLKGSLLSLESRLMFDAAAAATASEVASEQVAQEQAEIAVSSDSAADSRTAESNETQGLLEAIATYSPGESRAEVVFVDPTVPNYQDLLGGMNPNSEVIILDGGQDGVEQMATALSGRTDLNAIHLISHGDAGTLQLGTGTLNAENMSGKYADALATIRQALSEQADILVYGCDFAEGDTGQAAVHLLAELTGADVQASTDLTGHLSLGGDWELEVSTGTIETSLAVGYDVQVNWAAVLGTETVSDTFSTRSYDRNDGTQSWSSSWSESDAGRHGASGGDVRVNSGQLRIDADAVGTAISRGVDLSRATSATLSFAYTNRLTGADRVELRVSTDGGSTYRSLGSGVFSATANTGRGTARFDLSDSLSANTKIQFIVTDTDGRGGDRLQVDNIQVSYDTGPANNAPTVTNNGGGATASINVAENTSPVTTVTGTDVNAGQTLTYSIAGGADASQFAINSSTGQLSFVSAPNYEAPTDRGGNNIYDVTVQVSDGSGGTDTQVIAVNVTNVNEDPTITSNGGGAAAAVNVAENQTTVTTVVAADVDSGTTLTYSLAGGLDAARFTIDRTTGALQFATAPNFERASDGGRNNVYDVMVQVSDGQGGTATQSISVRVTDINEVPKITSNRGGDVASVTIRENSAAVTRVRATDPDRGTRMTYSVVGGADAALFTINQRTGVLRFNSAQNFEQPTDANRNNVYQVVVQASDGRGGIDSQVINVRVTNVNEAPTDLSLPANTVTENATTGTVVGRVTGTDQDASDTKTYSLTDTAGGRFAIDSTTGVIRVADGSVLDYESATNHTVTVRVTDRGGLTYDETFTINLTNVNEAPTGADTTITINKDTSYTLTTANFGFSDVDVGDSWSAVRIDTVPGAGTLTLSGVAVTAGQVMTVSDLTAGNLVFTPAADAKGTGYASFTFSVRDSGNLYDAVPNILTFDMTPVNDAPINTVPEAQTVVEDMPLTFTGLSVNDVDDNLSTVQLAVGNGTLRVSLAGGATISAGANDSSTLTLSGRQPQINAALATLTYQGTVNFAGSDTLTITSTDTNSGTDVDTVAITVTAVNDGLTGLPLITGTGTEDQTLTADTSGIADVDGRGPFSYQWLRNGMVIAGATGSTYTLGDADVGTQISVTVSYTDGQGTNESVTSAQTATVVKVNDTPILVTNTGSTVAEGGTDTIDASELAVTDVDNSAAQLTYTIGTGPAYGRLELITAPGITATTFTQADIAASRLIYIHDGSEPTSDSFTVTVNDGTGGAVGPTAVTLTILPVNDAPMILNNGGGATAAINVTENVTAVTIVTGADVDWPAQALTYNISGGVDQARFTINAATGVLNFTAPPDFEAATDANGDNVYVVQVQVMDSQGASTIQTIQITVTDVVESAPLPLPPAPTVPPVLLSPTPPPPTGGSTPGPGTSPSTSPVISVNTGPVPTAIPPVPTMPPPEVRPISQGPLTLVSPPGRPLERVLEEPRRPLDDVKDRALFLVNDDQGRPLFAVLPVEPAPTLESEPPPVRQSVSDLLMTKLDEMTMSLEQAVSMSQQQHELVARVTAVTGITLSVGFVVWALRSGAILASFMATMPAWRHVDPLPVLGLGRRERERRLEKARDDQQREAVEFKGLQALLDPES